MMSLPFKYLLIFLLGCVIKFVSCNYSGTKSTTETKINQKVTELNAKQNNIMEKRTIKIVTDIAPNNGQYVHVFGKYIEVDVRKRKIEPPFYAGHAAVELEDGTLIYLFPPHDKKAIRSQEEIEELRNKEIVAQGVISKECRRPKESIAYMKVPCLDISILVMEKESYEFLEGLETK